MTFFAVAFAELIIPLSLILGGILLFLLIIWHYNRQIKHVGNTQHKLTDKDLLLSFAAEPDGFLTAKRLMDKTSLTKSEAKFRITYLTYLGFIKTSYSNSFKAVHSLKEKIDQRDIPPLSNKPFLTVEDILKLFKTYDYSLSLQNMCIATGLPLSVIKKEMKYFEKEKIIEAFVEYTADGAGSKKFWTLKEPYRSDPEQFLELESKMNLDLEKLYDTIERKDDYV